MKLKIVIFLLTEVQVLALSLEIRISNSILNKEKGIHLKIPVEQRICPLCKQDIEDEYHFIMKCQNLDELRNKFFYEIISVVPHFFSHEQHRKTKFYFKQSRSRHK